MNKIDPKSPFHDVEDLLHNIPCASFDVARSRAITDIAEITFKILNYLDSDLACQILFPRAHISSKYIDYGGFAILRKNRMQTQLDSGLASNPVIILHAGNVMLKNDACQSYFPSMNLVPVLFTAFILANHIKDIFLAIELAKKRLLECEKKIKPNYILNFSHVPYLGTNLARNQFYCVGVQENTSSMDQRYIEGMELPSTLPMKFYDDKCIGRLIDEIFQLRPLNVLQFYNKYNQLCHYGISDYIDGKALELPLTEIKNEYTGQHNSTCFLNKNSPFFNTNIMHDYNDAKIILSSSVDGISSLLTRFRRYRHSDYIVSGWVGEIRKYDLASLQGRDVLYVLDSLQQERSLNAAAYLQNQAFSTANLFFRVVDGSQTGILDYNQLCQHAQAIGINLPKAQTSNRIEILDRARLKTSEEIPDKQIVIEGFAPLGSIFVVGGGPKLGKSLATEKLGYQISIGGQFWGFELNKMKVLIYDTELDAYDLKRRGYADKQSDNFHIILASEMDEDDKREFSQDSLEEHLAGIIAYVKKYDIDVVIIDCLYRLLDTSVEQQVTLLVNTLKKLKAMNKLVIVVHHLNKASVDRIDPFKNLAGHSNLARAIDGGIILLADEPISKATRMTATFLSRSFAPIPDLKLLFQGGVHYPIGQKVWSPEKSPEEQFIAIISKIVPATSDIAMPTEEIASRLAPHLNLSKETIQRKLPSWVREEYLSVIGNRPKQYYQGEKVLDDETDI